MTEQDFNQYINESNGLLDTIETAILKKDNIMNSSLNRKEKAQELVVLSESIRNKFICTRLFIHRDYFGKFINGDATTIDPFEERVKIKLSDKDDLKSYIEVRCDFWGPCDDFLYFMSPVRIVVVDEEAYVLTGEYEEFQKGKRAFLGGNKQNEDFPNYDSLEAPTHQNTINFCNQLMEDIHHRENKDYTMKNNLCILENNFFPALALNEKVSSIPCIISKWAKLFSQILRELLKFYDPKIVLGQRANLGYASPYYSGIFNQALGGLDVFRRENNKQSLLGRKIEFAERINTGKNKCSGIIDEKGTIWIGYTYFSRNYWSGYKGGNIITWLKEHIQLNE